MKVEYINPFVNATLNTYKTMLEEEVKPGKPELKSEPFPHFDVSGVIGISGDLVGNVVVSFPKITALRTVSKFAGEEIKVVGNELADGVAELVNIIAGSALPQLQGLRVAISLPTTILGTDHRIAGQKQAHSILVPFSSSFGEFSLEVNFKENK